MVNQKLEGDCAQHHLLVHAIHSRGFCYNGQQSCVCAYGCGEALLQLWWSPDTGDVGIFFPQGGGECRCAFYTSYPTTMVINYIPFTAVHFAALWGGKKKSCDSSVHPEWKNLVAPSFQQSHSRTKFWVGMTTIVTGNVRLLIPPHVSSMKIFKHSCTASSLVF